MGFWKTLGKIGAMAAPIVAAPFTGGTSLAAIGALSGLAGAKLSGQGLKGSLLSAGLGAIPGLAGAGKVAGAATPSLGQGLLQAGKGVIGIGARNAIPNVLAPTLTKTQLVGQALNTVLPIVRNQMQPSASTAGGGGPLGNINLGDIGTTVSAAAGGSATQRLAEADALTRRLAQANVNAANQAQADRLSAEFKQKEESRAYERALMNSQLERGPLTMSGTPTASFAPSALTYQNAPGPASAALMAQLAPVNQITPTAYQAPQMPGVNAKGIPMDLAQGLGEKALGAGGLVAKVLSSTDLLKNLGSIGQRPLNSTSIDVSRLPAAVGPMIQPNRPADMNIGSASDDVNFDIAPSTGIDYSQLPGYGTSLDRDLPLPPTAAAPQAKRPKPAPMLGPPAPMLGPPAPILGPPAPTPRPPLDTLYANLSRNRQPSTLDRMKAELTPAQQAALRGTKTATKLVAAGALAIPAAGAAAVALAPAEAMTLLGTITPKFLATATGQQLTNTLAALTKAAPLLTGRYYTEANRQIMAIQNRIAKGSR